MVQFSTAIAILIVIGVLAGVGAGAGGMILANPQTTSTRTTTQYDTISLIQTETEVNILPIMRTTTLTETSFLAGTTISLNGNSTPYGLSVNSLSITVLDPSKGLALWSLKVTNTANVTMTDLFAFTSTGSGLLWMYFPSQFNTTSIPYGQSASNSTYITGVTRDTVYEVDIYGYWSAPCSYWCNYLDLSLEVTAN